MDDVVRAKSIDEREYLDLRSEQWAREVRRSGRLTRRRALGLAAAGAPLLAGASALGRVPVAHALRRGDNSPGIVKPTPPELFNVLSTNAEMRWDAVDFGYLTPTDRFFVRNHTSTPMIEAATWRLRLYGDGLDDSPARRRPVKFSLRDLERMPQRTIVSAVECAGNGRSFFDTQQGTPASGTQWQLGAIGVAKWRGVALSEILERAGLRRAAVDAMPIGLDSEVVSDDENLGHVRRPLPISKALDDVIVALEMNGERLARDHGFPARLIVPGWVGIASIKWLGAIEVSRKPLFSPWNTDMYRLEGPTYPADTPPLTRQRVKSAFQLARGAQIPAGEKTTLKGRSWSGGGKIRRVDVSADGGETWSRAELARRNPESAWVRWSWDWTPGSPGDATLVARATDSLGRTQPETVPFNEDGYLFWAQVRHPVTVVA